MQADVATTIKAPAAAMPPGVFPAMRDSRMQDQAGTAQTIGAAKRNIGKGSFEFFQFPAQKLREFIFAHGFLGPHGLGWILDRSIDC
jgi:hypothetical protein